MNSKKGICILGSTGTIGVNTLDVISRHSDDYQVIALTANESTDDLEKQCIEYQPLYAVMVNEEKAELLHKRLATAGISTKVLAGKDSLEVVSALDEVDYVMAAIVGAAGLLPNLAAAKAGKRIMLANKESLVMSGALFMDTVHKYGAELLPIDSEHNAIFQSMPPLVNGLHEKSGVTKILLTGSGGPFRQKTLESLVNVTPEQAVAHPNWVMGRKISVDSATMMNKGLEVIETCWLFDVKEDQIQVVIHPESTIHSMVSYNDGSVIAQLGNPDMRTPIAYALGYPERIESGVEQLDIFDVAQLNFEKPDFERYRCLQLAYDAHHAGGYATIALNAANEIAVEAFLDNKVRFTDIPPIIENALEQASSGTPTNLNDILDQDLVSRKHAKSYIKGLQ
ncbi:1-deoxy-D-xylulose-5-phosphate reductoisomerase [Cocleimonas sp. KMM 6892]|uniref:1-deoxy-D-xylulose-5-phosphate reductoisomerase n=1 Tax=unclassified Cocleimonas TaxID=2639732 RepID=UPI002DB6E550|nr:MULTISPECIES: 1-deoxy-D-xylulose-5-phosphate reductoisomerase [unclassified Cocleimonas]MEB8431020.1 1-deoxy-D-xylulose-5-phosphate reductoisomerase [Cocleimonas sp. KMM 6892]MEC4714208.1 1-deoxy-D-xylulose-5-phosphate reductoisomerase [Cocleimonas sp. KMM 6895]MEC4743539.1 1-deoxy-D-xylulose-5-phosphate reductoisomerase [Cocleimonas sp. KMM 6896]